MGNRSSARSKAPEAMLRSGRWACRWRIYGKTERGEPRRPAHAEPRRRPVSRSGRKPVPTWSRLTVSMLLEPSATGSANWRSRRVTWPASRNSVAYVASRAAPASRPAGLPVEQPPSARSTAAPASLRMFRLSWCRTRSPHEPVSCRIPSTTRRYHASPTNLENWTRGTGRARSEQEGRRKNVVPANHREQIGHGVDHGESGTQAEAESGERERAGVEKTRARTGNRTMRMRVVGVGRKNSTARSDTKKPDQRVS